MAELACAVDSRFEVSRIEEEIEPQLSILTIEKLTARGIGRLSFLIGGDAFADIRSWYRWQDVVASVEFIVVTRPGAGWETASGRRSCMNCPDCSFRYPRRRFAPG